MLEYLEKTSRIEGMKKAIFSPRSSAGYRSLGENPGDRGNEQERSKKLTWISAMLECEGTFTFQYNEQIKNGKMHSHIQPRVIFVNSDISLVDAVEKMIVDLTGIVPYRRDGFKTGVGKREKSEVQINGFHSLPFLKEVRPYVVGAKGELVDILIRFIEYRQSLAQPKQRYGDLEFELLRRVREINSGHWAHQPKFSSISSETVRQRRAIAKTQPGLRGDAKSKAEMTLPLIQ